MELWSELVSDAKVLIYLELRCVSPSVQQTSMHQVSKYTSTSENANPWLTKSSHARMSIADSL